MTGVAAGFILMLAIGFSLGHGSPRPSAPVLDKNGFPVPIAVAAETTPVYRPGDTRLDVMARTLLPAPAFRVYSAVALPFCVGVLACGLVIAWRTRRRRRTRIATRVPELRPSVAGIAKDPKGARGLLSPEQLQEKVESLARTIQAPVDRLPTYGRSRDFGDPHIEIDEAYHWIVMERGHEIDRRTTRDLDELLYIIFQSVSFSMALDIEAGNRRKGEDFRRQLFDVNVSLLAQLDPRLGVPAPDRAGRDSGQEPVRRQQAGRFVTPRGLTRCR